MKHTPGPWFAKFEAGRFLINHQGEFGPYKTLAITGGFYPDNAANASLISAAPDLLNACRKLVDWCDKNPPSGEALHCVQLARNALRKAERDD